MTVTNAQLLLDIGAGKLARACCLLGGTGNSDDAIAFIDYLAQLSTEQKKLLFLRACLCAKCPTPGQITPQQQQDPGNLVIPDAPAGAACAATLVQHLCSDEGQSILTKIEALVTAASLLPQVAAEPILMAIIRAVQVAIVAVKGACRDPKLATQAATAICVVIQMTDPQIQKVQDVVTKLIALGFFGAVPIPAWLGNSAITALRACCKGGK